MTPTEKLSTAVPVMRDSLMQWCGHLNAIHLVGTNEHSPSPALDEVLSHVAEIHATVKALCGSYDKLRSMVGSLEKEQGVETPRFYVDANAGEICKQHCPVL